MAEFYRDFSDFIADHFKGKLQKISVNAGFTCPNRDGTVGTGGCTYCNNQSFNPDYCRPTLSVSGQIERGKEFFGRKYPDMEYLAYFQAYTSTHGDVSRLIDLYDEALAVPGVRGLVIGTRPDCMPDSLLERLFELNKRHFVLIEYGAESSHDRTLRLINRCHDWKCTEDAVMRTSDAGIPVGLHLIMGLPGETEDDILLTVDRVSRLPLQTVKLHQLQLIKGTRMAVDVESGIYDIKRYIVDEYIDLCCRVVERMNPAIAIERFTSQSPAELLLYPRWGLKNYEFVNLLNNRLRRLGIRQGTLFRDADCHGPGAQ